MPVGASVGADRPGRFPARKREGLIEVTLIWDGETAALDAALKAAEQFAGIGLSVRIALLPAGKDPGEVLRAAVWGARTYSPLERVRLAFARPNGPV